MTSHAVGAPLVAGRTTDGLGQRFTLATGEVGGHIVEVPVSTLDETLHSAVPMLIKMDVEGWESEVLAGAGSVLRRPGLRAIIVEMDGQQDSMNSTGQAVHATLTEHGFAPFSYDPFTRTLSALALKNLQAANTIYVRDMPTVQQRVASAPPFRVNGREI